MLLNSMKCDFSGPGGREGGEISSSVISLGWCSSTLSPPEKRWCWAPPALFWLFTKFLPQCFPAEMEPLKEASRIKSWKAFSYSFPHLLHLCWYLMFISVAAFIAFEFGQNNLLCNWANEFQPTLHLSLTAQRAANLFPVYLSLLFCC